MGSLLGSKPDPCSLVTVAEAQQALGEPVEDGTPTEPKTCLFKARRGEGNTVTVQLYDTSGQDRRAWFNKERLRRDSRLIPGLGDGAVRVDSASLSRLTFLHEDELVTVIVASTKQKHLAEAVTRLSRTVAERYGATLVATIPSTISGPIAEQDARRNAGSHVAPVTLTHTRPAPDTPQEGPKKSTSIDPISLIGTWHTRVSRGTTQHDLLLVIKPNLEWSLSSMMEFDGILNAESGLWALERANTFRGLGWKGTYRITTRNAFATTGSVQARWKRLVTDQPPSRIPTELWNLRREATSVPVFQFKTVDPDLVGQWEGAGTYAGGPATFVWAIQPSAATDLLIVDSLKGTVQSKDGLPQLQPTHKKQQRVSVIAFNDHGLTTTDGKTNLKWSKLQQPQSTESRQL
ncbi:MAG: hypothetical protein OEV01_08195 [Nitrospira sp.]|nr:hypothetical protein [Nitrospira sp.]MDH5193556.1 hypothetical protein [Nitrospira sp.]